MKRDDDAGVGECLQVALAIAAGGGHRAEKTGVIHSHHSVSTIQQEHRCGVRLNGSPMTFPAIRVGERWNDHSRCRTLLSLIPWCLSSTVR